jgi:hypothetical protein
MRWREDKLGDLRRVTVEQDGLSVVLLPDIGGKIIALRRIETGRNVLYEPPDFPYRRPYEGAAFEDFDTSGFDECFPTVSACPDPTQPARALPDHGWLWSRPWSCAMDGDELVTAVEIDDELRFERRLRIRGLQLLLSYRAQSRRAQPALWSAHPLFACSPGSRILLPRDVDSLLVNWSKDNRLGSFGAHCAWPGSGERRLDRIGPAETGAADKLFSPALRMGRCAFFDAASGESVLFGFDAAATPYVGLWICQGGWPLSRASKHYTVALEPCWGRPDALDEAVRRKEFRALAAGEVVTWSLTLELGLGIPDGPW